MLNSAALTEPEEIAVAAKATDVSLEDLIRRLLDRPAADPRHETTPNGEEVVADVEVDGVAYVLLRVAREPPPAPVSLSPREQEIVRLVAKGLPNKTIAAVLEVSLWTVATHLRRVFAKMGVNTRAEMVAYALSNGLIERVE